MYANSFGAPDLLYFQLLAKLIDIKWENKVYVFDIIAIIWLVGIEQVFFKNKGFGATLWTFRKNY